jgi:thioredoxin 1
MMAFTEQSFDEQVLSSEKPVLVDFSATWCPPCKMQKPVLERFAAEHPEIAVGVIDADASPAIANRHGVQALPTLIVFVNGKARASVRGLQTIDGLSALLARALEDR